MKKLRGRVGGRPMRVRLSLVLLMISHAAAFDASRCLAARRMTGSALPMVPFMRSEEQDPMPEAPPMTTPSECIHSGIRTHTAHPGPT